MPDLWENIGGGTTADVARNETPGQTYFRNLLELRDKGRAGYMAMYPETFDPSWSDPNVDREGEAEVAWRCARRI
ncbi:unnamed protein product, partial [marine sediment metagenome]